MRTTPGEPFPPAPLRSAGTVNAMVEAGEHYQLAKRLGQGGRDRGSPEIPTTVVKVKNSTGANLVIGEVIDLNTKAFTGSLTRRYPWFVAAVPNEQRVSAIVLEPIPTDHFGQAQLAGVCPALVNFSSTSHKWARVSSGDTVLQSNADSGPARVIVAPGSTGEQLVWVVLGAASTPAASLGIPFINLSGETVPPGGIMDWYDDIAIGNVLYVICYKPGLQFNRRWLVNGSTAVANGNTGLGYWLGDFSGMAAVDSGSLSVLNTRAGWGPRPGSWVLYPEMLGFTAVGTSVVFNGGVFTAHFRQHEVNHLKVLITEDVTRNSQTLVRILWRHFMGGQQFSPFTNEIVIQDGFYLRAGETIEATPYAPIVADVEWIANDWEITNAQCDPAEVETPSGSQNTPQGNRESEMLLPGIAYY